MAEPAPKPAAPAAPVKVQLPDGRMGTIAPSEVGKVLDQPGSRLVSDAEFSKAQRDLNLESKYSGVGGTLAGHVEANLAGGLRGLTAGLSDPLILEAAGAFSPSAKEAARSKLSELKEAFPIESTRGELGGIIVPALASGGSRAPIGVSGLLARGSAAIEAGAMRAAGGAAGLGERVAMRGLATGAAGAFEGAAYGVGHEISEASLGNHELAADKLFAGAKGGALYGFVGGAAFGAGGELVGGAFRSAPKTFATPARESALPSLIEERAGNIASQQRRSFARISLNQEAGLQGRLPAAEDVFSFGPERRPMRIFPGASQNGRVAAEEPFSIASRFSIDPDAGLRIPGGPVGTPLSSPFSQGATKAQRRAAVEAGLYEGAEAAHGVQVTDDIFKAAKMRGSSQPIKSGYEVAFDAEAGLSRRGAGGRFQGRIEAGEPIRPSAVKSAPRDVLFSPADDLSAIEASSPIKISRKGIGLDAVDSGRTPMLDVPRMPAPQLSALEKLGGEAALRHAGANKAIVTNLDRFAPGGHQAVGKLLAEEAPSLVGKQHVRQMTQELWAEAAGKGKQMHGGAMDAVLRSQSLANAQVKVADIVADIRSVAAPYRNDLANIGKAGVVRQIDGFADDLARRAGLTNEAGEILNPNAAMSVRDIHDVRRAADDLWAGNKINPVAGPIKDVRNIVSNRLDSEIYRFGGAEALGAWKAANTRWQAYRALERAAANGGARSGANQFLSLTDKWFAAVGAGLGTAVAGPAGAVAGGAVAGLASKAFRARFDAWTADALLKTARIGAARELMGEVDAQIGSAVGRFLDRGAVKEAALAAGSALGARASTPQAARVGKVSRDEYERIAGQIAHMQVQRREGRVPHGEIENFAAAAPNVSAALAAGHSRAVDYLASKMPPARVDHSAAFVPGSMYMPKALSPVELKWLRSVEAVKDPMGVLRDFKKGHITGDQVDALKAVYPSLYAHLREKVMEQAKRNGRRLTVEQSSALGILLGEPVHYTQRPEFLSAMQASKAMAAPLDEQAGGAPSPSRKPDMNTGAARAGTVGEEIER